MADIDTGGGNAVNAAWKDGVTVLDEAALSRYLYTAGLPDPDLVILDEPFSGLDPVNENLFRKAILDAKLLWERQDSQDIANAFREGVTPAVAAAPAAARSLPGVFAESPPARALDPLQRSHGGADVRVAAAGDLADGVAVGVGQPGAATHRHTFQAQQADAALRNTDDFANRGNIQSFYGRIARRQGRNTEAEARAWAAAVEAQIAAGKPEAALAMDLADKIAAAQRQIADLVAFTDELQQASAAFERHRALCRLLRGEHPWLRAAQRGGCKPAPCRAQGVGWCKPPDAFLFCASVVSTGPSAFSDW